MFYINYINSTWVEVYIIIQNIAPSAMSVQVLLASGFWYELRKQRQLYYKSNYLSGKIDFNSESNHLINC